MNDASPRFDEADTSAASRLPSKGHSVSLTALAQHAGELSVGLRKKG
jgi:hypothetical protein